MTRQAHAHNTDSAGLQALVAAILQERRKIDRVEGDVVAGHVRLAHHLAELRVLAQNDWAKQLKTVGISPRVASRYLQVARHWPEGIGLRESELLPRLPADLLKLEWLCRVPLPRLGDLLNTLDCKAATRAQVIAAVRRILGEETTTTDRPEPDVDLFARRLLDRLKKTVDRLPETFPDPEDHHRVRELLAEGFREVLETLTIAPSPETTR